MKICGHTLSRCRENERLIELTYKGRQYRFTSLATAREFCELHPLTAQAERTLVMDAYENLKQAWLIMDSAGELECSRRGQYYLIANVLRRIGTNISRIYNELSHD